MFKVLPADVERLRTPGGDLFARFVNDLIRAHARAHGIPASAINLNAQTVEADGGVDAEVTEAAKDDPSGYLAHPTAWQFKATEAANAGPSELEREIKKPFAMRRIQDGYAFYVCICDQLTPAKRSSRESKMLHTARGIFPSALVPRVLDANDLAEIASRYPAVVLRHIRPQVSDLCLSLDAWQPTATRLTPHYVQTADSEEAWARIREHISFELEPQDVVSWFAGKPG